jgi:hypothetical protein
VRRREDEIWIERTRQETLLAVSKAREDSYIYLYKGGSARLKHPIRGIEKMASRWIHTMPSQGMMDMKQG